jgi:hypothetical protein
MSDITSGMESRKFVFGNSPIVGSNVRGGAETGRQQAGVEIDERAERNTYHDP